MSTQNPHIFQKPLVNIDIQIGYKEWKTAKERQDAFMRPAVILQNSPLDESIEYTMKMSGHMVLGDYTMVEAFYAKEADNALTTQAMRKSTHLNKQKIMQLAAEGADMGYKLYPLLPFEKHFDNYKANMPKGTYFFQGHEEVSKFYVSGHFGRDTKSAIVLPQHFITNSDETTKPYLHSLGGKPTTTSLDEPRVLQSIFPVNKNGALFLTAKLIP